MLWHAVFIVAAICGAGAKDHVFSSKEAINIHNNPSIISSLNASFHSGTLLRKRRQTYQASSRGNYQQYVDNCPHLSTTCPECLYDVTQLPHNLCDFPIVIRVIALGTPSVADSSGRVCGRLGITESIVPHEMTDFRRLLKYSIASHCLCNPIASTRYYIISTEYPFHRDGSYFSTISLSSTVYFLQDRNYEPYIRKLLETCHNQPLRPEDVYIPVTIQQGSNYAPPISPRMPPLDYVPPNSPAVPLNPVVTRLETPGNEQSEPVEGNSEVHLSPAKELVSPSYTDPPKRYVAPESFPVLVSAPAPEHVILPPTGTCGSSVSSCPLCKLYEKNEVEALYCSADFAFLIGVERFIDVKSNSYDQCGRFVVSRLYEVTKHRQLEKKESRKFDLLISKTCSSCEHLYNQGPTITLLLGTSPIVHESDGSLVLTYDHHLFVLLSSEIILPTCAERTTPRPLYPLPTQPSVQCPPSLATCPMCHNDMTGYSNAHCTAIFALIVQVRELEAYSQAGSVLPEIAVTRINDEYGYGNKIKISISQIPKLCRRGSFHIVRDLKSSYIPPPPALSSYISLQNCPCDFLGAYDGKQVLMYSNSKPERLTDGSLRLEQGLHLYLLPEGHTFPRCIIPDRQPLPLPPPLYTIPLSSFTSSKYRPCLPDNDKTCPSCFSETQPPAISPLHQRYCASKFAMVIATGLHYERIPALQDRGYGLPLSVFRSPSIHFTIIRRFSRMLETQYVSGLVEELIITVRPSFYSEEEQAVGNCFVERVRTLHDVWNTRNPFERVVDLDLHINPTCECTLPDAIPGFGLLLSDTQLPERTESIVPLTMTSRFAFYPLPINDTILPACDRKYYSDIRDGSVASYVPTPINPVAPRIDCPYDSVDSCPQCHLSLTDNIKSNLCSYEFAIIAKMDDLSELFNKHNPSLEIKKRKNSGFDELVLTVSQTSSYMQPTTSSQCRTTNFRVIRDLRNSTDDEYPRGRVDKAYMQGHCYCHFTELSTGYAIILSHKTPRVTQPHGFQLTSDIQIMCLTYGEIKVPICSAPRPNPTAGYLTTQTSTYPETTHQSFIAYDSQSPEATYISEVPVQPAVPYKPTLPPYVLPQPHKLHVPPSTLPPYVPQAITPNSKRLKVVVPDSRYLSTSLYVKPGCVIPGDISCPICSSVSYVPPSSYCEAPYAIMAAATAKVVSDSSSPCTAGFMNPMFDLSSGRTVSRLAGRMLYTIPNHCNCPVLQNAKLVLIIVKDRFQANPFDHLQLNSEIEIYKVQSSGKLPHSWNLPTCSIQQTYPRSKFAPKEELLPVNFDPTALDNELIKCPMDLEMGSCPRCNIDIYDNLEDVLCSSDKSYIIKSSKNLKPSEPEMEAKSAISVYQMFSNDSYSYQIEVKPINDTMDVCQLPMDIGNCNSDVIRYYFDTDINDCVTFNYSGCDGNENNFVSLDMCEKACMSEWLCRKQERFVWKEVTRGQHQIVERNMDVMLPNHCHCDALDGGQRILLIYNASHFDNASLHLNEDVAIIPLPTHVDLKNISCRQLIDRVLNPSVNETVITGNDNETSKSYEKLEIEDFVMPVLHTNATNSTDKFQFDTNATNSSDKFLFDTNATDKLQVDMKVTNATDKFQFDVNATNSTFFETSNNSSSHKENIA